MSAFEAKLESQARERMARIRAEADPLGIPRVAFAFDGVAGEDDGFLDPEAAAARMGISVGELLHLAEVGMLAHRGRGQGLRVRPALLSGAVPAAAPASAASRDLEVNHAQRDRALAGSADEGERPHVGFA